MRVFVQSTMFLSSNSLKEGSLVYDSFGENINRVDYLNLEIGLLGLKSSSDKRQHFANLSYVSEICEDTKSVTVSSKEPVQMSLHQNSYLPQFLLPKQSPEVSQIIKESVSLPNLESFCNDCTRLTTLTNLNKQTVLPFDPAQTKILNINQQSIVDGTNFTGQQVFRSNRYQPDSRKSSDESFLSLMLCELERSQLASINECEENVSDDAELDKIGTNFMSLQNTIDNVFFGGSSALLGKTNTDDSWSTSTELMQDYARHEQNVETEVRNDFVHRQESFEKAQRDDKEDKANRINATGKHQDCVMRNNTIHLYNQISMQTSPIINKINKEVDSLISLETEELEHGGDLLNDGGDVEIASLNTLEKGPFHNTDEKDYETKSAVQDHFDKKEDLKKIEPMISNLNIKDEGHGNFSNILFTPWHSGFIKHHAIEEPIENAVHNLPTSLDGNLESCYSKIDSHQGSEELICSTPLSPLSVEDFLSEKSKRIREEPACKTEPHQNKTLYYPETIVEYMSKGRTIVDNTITAACVNCLNQSLCTEERVRETNKTEVKNEENCFSKNKDEVAVHSINPDSNVEVLLTKGLRKLLPRNNMVKRSFTTSKDLPQEVKKALNEHEEHSSWSTGDSETITARREERSRHTVTDTIDNLVFAQQDHPHADSSSIKIDFSTKRDNTQTYFNTTRRKSTVTLLDSSWLHQSRISLDTILSMQTNSAQVEAIRRLNTKTRIYGLLTPKVKTSKSKVPSPAYSIQQAYATLGLRKTQSPKRRVSSSSASWIQLQKGRISELTQGPNKSKHQEISSVLTCEGKHTTKRDRIQEKNDIGDFSGHMSLLRGFSSQHTMPEGSLQALPPVQAMGDGLSKCNDVPSYWIRQLRSRDTLVAQRLKHNTCNTPETVSTRNKQNENTILTKMSSDQGDNKNVGFKTEDKIAKHKNRRTKERLKTEYIVIEPTREFQEITSQLFDRNVNRNQNPTAAVCMSSKYLQNRNCNKVTIQKDNISRASTKKENFGHYNFRKASANVRYSIFSKQHLSSKLMREQGKKFSQRRLLKTTLMKFFDEEIHPQPSYWDGVEKFKLSSELNIIVSDAPAPPEAFAQKSNLQVQESNTGVKDIEGEPKLLSALRVSTKREKRLSNLSVNLREEKAGSLVTEAFFAKSKPNDSVVDGSESLISLLTNQIEDKTVDKSESSSLPNDPGPKSPKIQTQDPSDKQNVDEVATRTGLSKKKKKSKFVKQRKQSSKPLDLRSSVKADIMVPPKPAQSLRDDALIRQSRAEITETHLTGQQSKELTRKSDMVKSGAIRASKSDFIVLTQPVSNKISSKGLEGKTSRNANFRDNKTMRYIGGEVTNGIKDTSGIGSKTFFKGQDVKGTESKATNNAHEKENRALTPTMKSSFVKKKMETVGTCVYCGAVKRIEILLDKDFSALEKHHQPPNAFPYHPKPLKATNSEMVCGKECLITEFLCDECYKIREKEDALMGSSKHNMGKETHASVLTEKERTVQASPRQTNSAPMSSTIREKVMEDSRTEVAVSLTPNMPKTETSKKKRSSELSIENHIKRMEMANKMKERPEIILCCKKEDLKLKAYVRFTDKEKTETNSAMVSRVSKKASSTSASPKSSKTKVIEQEDQEQTPKDSTKSKSASKLGSSENFIENVYSSKVNNKNSTLNTGLPYDARKTGHNSSRPDENIKEHHNISDEKNLTDSTKDDQAEMLPGIALNCKDHITKTSPRWWQYDISNPIYSLPSYGMKQYRTPSPLWRACKRISRHSAIVPSYRSLYRDRIYEICFPVVQADNATSKLDKPSKDQIGSWKKKEKPRTASNSPPCKYGFGKPYKFQGDELSESSLKLSIRKYRPCTLPEKSQPELGLRKPCKDSQKRYRHNMPPKAPQKEFPKLCHQSQIQHCQDAQSKSQQIENGLCTTSQHDQKVYEYSRPYQSTINKGGLCTPPQSPRKKCGPTKQYFLYRNEYGLDTSPESDDQIEFGIEHLSESSQLERGSGSTASKSARTKLKPGTTTVKSYLSDFQNRTVSSLFNQLGYLPLTMFKATTGGHAKKDKSHTMENVKDNKTLIQRLCKKANASKFDGNEFGIRKPFELPLSERGSGSTSTKSSKGKLKAGTKTVRSYLTDFQDEKAADLELHLGYVPHTYFKANLKKRKPSIWGYEHSSLLATEDVKDNKSTAPLTEEEAFIRSLRRCIDVSKDKKMLKVNLNERGISQGDYPSKKNDRDCQLMLDTTEAKTRSWLISSKRSATEDPCFQLNKDCNTLGTVGKRAERMARPEASNSGLGKGSNKTTDPVVQKSPSLVKSDTRQKKNNRYQDGLCTSTSGNLGDENNTESFPSREDANQSRSCFRRRQYNLWSPQCTSSVYTRPRSTLHSLHRKSLPTGIIQTPNETLNDRGGHFTRNSCCTLLRQTSNDISTRCVYRNSNAENWESHYVLSNLRDPRRYKTDLPYIRERKSLPHQRLILRSLPRLTTSSRQPFGSICLQYNLKRKL